MAHGLGEAMHLGAKGLAEAPVSLVVGAACLLTSGQIRKQGEGIAGVQLDFSFFVQPKTPAHGVVPLTF